MANAKVAIIYYSMGGTNYELAKWAKEAVESAGSEARILKVQELAPKEAIEGNPVWKAHVDATQDIPVATSEDLEWADAVIFSTPTRFGNVPSQIKQFLDTQGGLWAQGKLVNKVVSAMSSAQNPHGGQEATILSLYTTMYHWGSIVVAPGYLDPSVGKAGGNPYGTSVSVDQEGKMVEDVEDAVRYQTRRTLEVAEKLMK